MYIYYILYNLLISVKKSCKEKKEDRLYSIDNQEMNYINKTIVFL